MYGDSTRGSFIVENSFYILDFLSFQMNLQIALSNSVKSCVDFFFYGIESVDCIRQDSHVHYIYPANP